MYNVLVVSGKACWGRDIQGKVECELYVIFLRKKGYSVKVIHSPDFAEGDYNYWDVNTEGWTVAFE